MKTCPVCNAPIPLKARGKTATYCSSRCRVAAWRERNKGWSRVPVDMRTARRWTNRAGKRPMAVIGDIATSTNAQTWSEFSAVNKDSCGFMLGSGFACIDLDDCFTTEGVPNRFARAVLDSVPGAFVERSLSGRGLHIFGCHEEVPGRVYRHGEFYSRARFIAMTGEVFRQGDLVDLRPAVQLLATCV